ncbi:MAG TPA: hypothetical protein VGP90_06000 [Acidimicrobiia bacterium]|nr:hypothetical protein [Acidimicrobiia bacterium]
MSGTDTMRFESMCGGGIFFLPDITNVQPARHPSGSRSGTTA